MNAERNAFNRKYAYSFAAWEIRLYLNSHPRDRQALRLYQTYQDQSPCCNYAAIPQYPRSGDSDDPDGMCSLIVWPWVDEPWPWEREANEQRGGV